MKTHTRPVPVPVPVVDWTAVVQAADPLSKPTRGRYRTLLKGGLGSRGFTTPVPAAGGRLAGKRTFHSVLAALAFRADRAGDEEGAEYLTETAERLERRYSGQLREFLRRDSLEELPKAEFYDELVADTRAAVSQWRHLTDVLFATGEIIDTARGSARIEAVTADKGARVELLLPASLVEAMHSGDSLWVFRSLVGRAAVVDVLPAVSGPLHSGSQPGPKEDEDDDEVRVAARYASGPGAMPNQHEMRELIRLVEDRPFPQLTLVG